MIVCATHAVEMVCKKNGVVVRHPKTGWCVRGDVFACPICDQTTIVTAKTAYEERVTVVGETYYDLREW
jgi:hypothetical protein